MVMIECPSGHVVTIDDDVILPGSVSIGSHGYAQVCGAATGKVVLLHRWLMDRTAGDGSLVDHKDRDRMNCRRSNLRIVTPSMSSANRGATVGRDLPRGVSHARYSPGRFSARAQVERRGYHLGTYDTATEAGQAAHEWRLAHMPGYTG